MRKVTGACARALGKRRKATYKLRPGYPPRHFHSRVDQEAKSYRYSVQASLYLSLSKSRSRQSIFVFFSTRAHPSGPYAGLSSAGKRRPRLQGSYREIRNACRYTRTTIEIAFFVSPSSSLVRVIAKYINPEAQERSLDSWEWYIWVVGPCWTHVLYIVLMRGICTMWSWLDIYGLEAEVALEVDQLHPADYRCKRNWGWARERERVHHARSSKLVDYIDLEIWSWADARKRTTGVREDIRRCRTRHSDRLVFGQT